MLIKNFTFSSSTAPAETGEIRTTEVLFSTKILDIRWAARRVLRFINRRGLACVYYPSYYKHFDRWDDATGTLNIGGIQAEQAFATDGLRDGEVNAEIGYLDPIFIKVSQPNYTNQLTLEEKGNIYLEEAIITVPVVANFKRWDKLRVQDKHWVVMEEPQLVYDFKSREIEAFRLVCRSLRPGILGF